LTKLSFSGATLASEPTVMGQRIGQGNESLMQVLRAEDVIIEHCRGISIAPELDLHSAEINANAARTVSSYREQVAGSLDLTHGKDGVCDFRHNRIRGDRFKRCECLRNGAGNLTSDSARVNLGHRSANLGNLALYLGLLPGHSSRERSSGLMQVIHCAKDA
jgi:hypothetical protein